MALFDNNREQSESLSGDAATRALSVTVVENDFVAGVYEKLANVYDVVFGPTLHPGRLEAIRKMNIRARDSVLEVGVGTGINLSLYPMSCAITGIDQLAFAIQACSSGPVIPTSCTSRIRQPIASRSTSARNASADGNAWTRISMVLSSRVSDCLTLGSSSTM